MSTPDFLIDQVGVPVDANSICGRLSREAQERVDATLAQWFGNDSELCGHDEASVLELGKHVV